MSHCCWGPMMEPGLQMRHQAITSAAVSPKSRIIQHPISVPVRPSPAALPTITTIVFVMSIVSSTLAVDGGGARGGVDGGEELADDGIRGRGSVDEEEVHVPEAGLREAPGVVDFLVEPDDGGDVVRPKVVKIHLQWTHLSVHLKFFNCEIRGSKRKC